MNTFIFDLYNTLIKIHTDEAREQTWRPVVSFFGDRGIDADWETLRDSYARIWDEQLKSREAEGVFEYPEGNISGVFKQMSLELGGESAEFSDETAADAAKCMRRASHVELKVFDGVFELFARLRGAGAKLYLLSNAQADITYDEIASCNLTDKFDGMLISSECGCRKPDPAFFKMLFDKYGLNKKTAIMVGDDKESDGKGAKAFGIKYLCTPGGAAAFADKLVKLATEV